MDKEKGNLKDTLQVYINYRDRLCKHIKEYKRTFEENKDRAHNSMVVSAMLQSTNNIKMLCGKLSPFRLSFYEDISKNFIKNKVLNESQAQTLSEELKKSVIGSWRSFIDKQNSLFHIYIIDYDKNNFKNLIDTELFKNSIRKDKFIIHKFPANFYDKISLNHVLEGDDKIVRFEDNHEDHTATVVVKPSEKVVKNLKATFKMLDSIMEVVPKEDILDKE